MTFVKKGRPFVIAGPCVAESLDILEAVAAPLAALAKELDFDFVFKSSFDKANRTAVDSYRGPGMDLALQWFEKIKKKHGLPILTDVHETGQCLPVAEVCDVLQIPAFLCRQTDLMIAATATGRMVNVKKGQFMAPGSMAHVVEKGLAVCREKGLPAQIAVTERGASFGYGNLVVDMRSFQIMAAKGTPVIFDITHSTQLPPMGGDSGKTSGGDRHMAPLLARAATATGYLSGFFLEVHPDPLKAKSDKEAQLSLTQAQTLLRQLIPLWRQAQAFSAIDCQF